MFNAGTPDLSNVTLTQNLVKSHWQWVIINYNKYNKKLTGLNGQLSTGISSTLTSCKEGSYSHINTHSLGHYYCILNLSDLYSSVQKKNFKKLNISTIIWLTWPCTSTRTPAPGVIKFTILVDPSLVIIILYTQFVWSRKGSREKYFKRNVVFSLYNLHSHAS